MSFVPASPFRKQSGAALSLCLHVPFSLAGKCLALCTLHSLTHQLWETGVGLNAEESPYMLVTITYMNMPLQ
jgi:hypothetical protein